jgi:hypothetical protein
MEYNEVIVSEFFLLGLEDGAEIFVGVSELLNSFSLLFERNSVF